MIEKERATRLLWLGQELERRREFMVESLMLALEFALLHTRHVYPQWLFEILPKLAPQYSPEHMVLKWKPEVGWMVLMKQRPDDPNDPWPNQLHIFGTTLRPFDEEGDMEDRAISGELKNPNIWFMDAFKFLTSGDPEVLESDPFRYRERGTCMHNIRVALVPPNAEFDAGHFYNLKNPPKNTVLHHVGFFRRAVEWLEGRNMLTEYKQHFKTT